MIQTNQCQWISEEEDVLEEEIDGTIKKKNMNSSKKTMKWMKKQKKQKRKMLKITSNKKTFRIRIKKL